VCFTATARDLNFVAVSTGHGHCHERILDVGGNPQLGSPPNKQLSGSRVLLERSRKIPTMRLSLSHSILSLSLVVAALGSIAAERVSLAARPTSATILDHETVVDLQPFRRVTSAELRAADGRTGRARLFDLSPNVHEWYLLEVRWRENELPIFYHLDNPRPTSQRLEVDAEGLVRVDSERRVRCGAWSDFRSALQTASRSGLPYAPLCDGGVYVRNPAHGSKTQLEWATDFLRDYVPKGEAITSLVKRIFFADRFLLPAHDVDLGGAGKGPPRPLRGGIAPDAARIDPAYASWADACRRRVVPGRARSRCIRERDSPESRSRQSCYSAIAIASANSTRSRPSQSITSSRST